MRPRILLFDPNFFEQDSSGEINVLALFISAVYR